MSDIPKMVRIEEPTIYGLGLANWPSKYTIVSIPTLINFYYSNGWSFLDKEECDTLIIVEGEK